MNHWSDNLPRGACEPAVIWASTQPTLDDAWRDCQRGDWMLWLLAECSADRRLLVRAAALCAEPAAALADEYTEAVCLSVIQTCVAWSEGDATDEDLRVAAAAAWAAAWAAASAAWAAARAAASAAGDAAKAAARAAASAAGDAAKAARAAAAAASAAEAAAWAAWAAWAAEASRAATREDSLAHSANIMRGLFPRAPRLAT